MRPWTAPGAVFLPYASAQPPPPPPACRAGRYLRTVGRVRAQKGAGGSGTEGHRLTFDCAELGINPVGDYGVVISAAERLLNGRIRQERHDTAQQY